MKMKQNPEAGMVKEMWWHVTLTDPIFQVHYSSYFTTSLYDGLVGSKLLWYERQQRGWRSVTQPLKQQTTASLRRHGGDGGGTIRSRNLIFHTYM